MDEPFGLYISNHRKYVLETNRLEQFETYLVLKVLHFFF